MRVTARAALVGIAVTWCLEIGLPVDPLLLFGMFWLTAVAWRIDQPLRSHLAFARDWGLPVMVLLAYTYTTGLVYKLGLPVHYTFPIRFDRWIGVGELPGQRIQRAICGEPCLATGANFLDPVWTVVYLSHFVCAWLIAIGLWLHNRVVWISWITRFIILNTCGLAIYVIYPMAPPWLASQHGYLSPHVTSVIDRGGHPFGMSLETVLHGPLANPVAAMPSLHASIATLVALFIIQRLNSRWRWLALLYPLAMCFTLVYYGQHYVVDEVAGVMLAIVVHLACTRWERSRSGGAAEQAAQHVHRDRSRAVA